VGQDNFDSDNLFAFDEDQNIMLVEPIRVDIGGKDGFISAGNIVASHYVFFDSLNGYHLERGDYVWIDPKDPFRLWVAWAGSSPGDYIRVFTAKSPGV